MEAGGIEAALTEPAPAERALLRVEIDGSWTAAEMGALLVTLDRAYQAASAVRAAPLIGLRFGRMYGAIPAVVDAGTVDGMVARGRATYGDLDVASLRFESPGWLEFLGNLNPLRVIAEAVGQWRAETTERKRIDVEAKRQAATFLLEALRALPPEDQANRDMLLARLVALWPEEGLRAIARDTRVTNVSLQPVA